MTFEAELSGHYAPVAVYYEDADVVEYIRQDTATVSQRVDEFLTLQLKMDGREPIGFRLKGFKNFYIRYLKEALDERDDFLALVNIIEKAIQLLGDKAFEDQRAAYDQAYQIAKEDDARLRELPDAA